MQQSQQAPPPPVSASTLPPPSSSSGGSAVEAPPKQVAQAMDKFGQAERIIADIRIGADRVFETLFVVASQPHQGRKELEESGVISKSVQLRKDFWELHMPLDCPDGAMVAYAWKQ